MVKLVSIGDTELRKLAGAFARTKTRPVNEGHARSLRRSPFGSASICRYTCTYDLSERARLCLSLFTFYIPSYSSWTRVQDESRAAFPLGKRRSQTETERSGLKIVHLARNRAIRNIPPRIETWRDPPRVSSFNGETFAGARGIASIWPAEEKGLESFGVHEVPCKPQRIKTN